MIYKVFYTDRFIPSKFGGYTIGPFIFIRPKYEGDRGLLEHEKEHVRQFWRYPVVFFFLYLLSRRWRLKFEVDAYRVQLGWYSNDRIDLFAGFLVGKYNLDITTEEAKRYLREGV